MRVRFLENVRYEKVYEADLPFLPPEGTVVTVPYGDSDEDDYVYVVTGRTELVFLATSDNVYRLGPYYNVYVVTS